MDGIRIALEIDLPSIDPSWAFYAVGDFDGNGTMDMVWAKSDRTLVLWLMDKTVLNQPMIIDNAGTAPAGVVSVEP